MFTLSKSEAAQKNNAVSMDERVRRTVHELTHHLIAEHYGLICEGIELGYMEGQSPLVCGVAHIGDNLRRRQEAGEAITPEEQRSYVHAILSNGYGDEAVFGTPPELRGDEHDVLCATRYMETQWGYEPDDIDAFIAGYSGEGERRFRREAERRSGAKVNSSRSEATLA